MSVEDRRKKQWEVIDVPGDIFMDFFDTYKLDDERLNLRYSFMYSCFYFHCGIVNDHKLHFRLFMYNNEGKNKKRNCFLCFAYYNKQGMFKELKFGITHTYAIYLKRRTMARAEKERDYNEKGVNKQAFGFSV